MTGVGPLDPVLPGSARLAPDPFFQADREGKVLYANPAAEELLGALGVGVGDLLPERFRSGLEQSMQEGRSEIEVHGGQTVWRVVCACLPDRSGGHFFARDRTAGHVAASFPDKNPNPVLRLLEEGTLEYANPASAPILEGLGIGVGDPLPEDFLQEIRSRCDADDREPIPLQAGGSHFEIIPARSRDLGRITLYGTDVSARLVAEQTESELIRSERLAGLGGMVAGIAHEINTPLGISVTAASLAREQFLILKNAFETGSLTRQRMESVLASGEAALDLLERNLDRTADLVYRFKGIAADQTSEAGRRVELGSYIEEAVRSLTPLVRQLHLRVEVTRMDPSIDVLTFPGSVVQIVTNLVANAGLHAYPEGAGGPLRFRVERAAGGGARLVCEDEGVGMYPDVAARIFEPFFTTRRGTGGTGLGLHIVHNVVTRLLGGSIEVDSAPGEGCRFTIGLPASAPGAARNDPALG